VSCVHVRWISQIQVFLVLWTLLEQRTLFHNRFLFANAEKFCRSKISHFFFVHPTQ
jgi:hypothetical protein